MPLPAWPPPPSACLVLCTTFMMRYTRTRNHTLQGGGGGAGVQSVQQGQSPAIRAQRPLPSKVGARS